MPRVFCLFTLILFLTADSALPYYSIKPPKPKVEPCHLGRRNRHNPKKCSAGVCKMCTDKACSRANCGMKRKKVAE